MRSIRVFVALVFLLGATGCEHLARQNSHGRTDPGDAGVESASIEGQSAEDLRHGARSLNRASAASAVIAAGLGVASILVAIAEAEDGVEGSLDTYLAMGSLVASVTSFVTLHRSISKTIDANARSEAQLERAIDDLRRRYEVGTDSARSKP